jgi:hypothetical protein
MAKAKINAAKKIEKTTTKVSPKASKQVAKKGAKAVKAAPKSEAAPVKLVKKAVDGQNPYRVGGGYWAAVEALRSLGMGKLHSFEKIVPAIIKLMKAEKTYADFASKKGKLTPEQRILTNVMVTARADYGKPLAANKLEVRWNGREKQAGLFRLGK